ncbi:hypothetical protein HS088_TW23G01009 [Tripterygium wilfordii]|uniref:DUF868 family protein n=1 Tax=Tripterygium wilfordii TaxID=458696 RepID=A0A7J7BXB8_TRIWF|nr:uncharacterized protein LOC119993182 [Tripterygium wilfordii]KAF5726267.1 hypothetical protein HS088_TW23G01009 [Tripterygium wilfordii]
MSHQTSPFPSCFRPSTTAADEIHRCPPTHQPAASASGNPTVNTCLYQTDLGIFSVTWSRTVLGRSLHLNLHPIDYAAGGGSSPLSLSDPLSLSTLYFHLHIKHFFFCKKHGSKKLYFIDQENKKTRRPTVQIFWDLSKAKFGSGSGPEPQSGFYIAVVVDGEMTLLVGDCTKEAYSKTKAKKPERNQGLVLRREHLFGNRVYTTKARFGGKNREISIDCRVDSEARLCFSVDNKRVLLIKRLKWKFRGNETIEVDGVPVQISWDVYNWFFDEFKNGHAVFMFRFEEEEEEGEEKDKKEIEACSVEGNEKNGVVSWQQNLEWRKMRKSWLRTARSSSWSSISISSASNSSACSSSVMEWVDAEETESSGPNNGFSLLVYAWRK